jgi:hypothetical protein
MRTLRRRFITARTAMITARPPTIPMMLNVAPTAALLLKKPFEAAPAVGVSPEETVVPGLVGRVPDNPDVETGLLRNVVVGLLKMLDVAPTDELKKIVKHQYKDYANGSKHT